MNDQEYFVCEATRAFGCEITLRCTQMQTDNHTIIICISIKILICTSVDLDQINVDIIKFSLESGFRIIYWFTLLPIKNNIPSNSVYGVICLLTG